MRSIVEYLRSQQVLCAVYIDDGIVTANTKQETETCIKITRDCLRKSGFVTNDKSIWEPVHKLGWG